MNTLFATVTDVVYQGAFRRVLVAFDAGGTGQVRDADATVVTAGDRVEVSWPVEAGVVVADSPVADPVPA